MQSRLRQWLRQLAATYFAFDPRSLGLFRIVLGIVLLVDLWQRYRGIDYWFTDEGLLPRQLLGGAPNLFSIFLWVSSPAGALALMLVCALVYVCFTLGVLTRVAHVLALICVTSLNSRVFVLENGGHLALNLLTTWSLFLPLGRRFSVDALIGSLRARRERSVAELADRAPMRLDSDRPVWSLAVLALLLQFAAIYAFNVVHKTGPKWDKGTAVHYVLNDESLNTIVAVWLREYLPYSVLHLLARATIAVEAAAVLLILWPLWSRHARLLAVALLPALHLGFTLCLRLAVFSHAMASFFALLLAPEHWAWLEARRRRRSERLRARAWIDVGDGPTFQLARLYARLDPDERVRFDSGERGAALRVRIEADGREVRGWAAVVELARRLPGGGLLGFALRLPGVAAIVTRGAGLVRGRLAGEAATAAPQPGRPRSPTFVRAPWIVAREAAVAVLMAAAVGDVVHSNPAIPQAWRFERPAWLYRLVWIPRNRQYWHMFSPDPAGSIATLSVEARTAGGRIVDPFNEVAGRLPRLPERGALPERLFRDPYFAYYADRVRAPEHAWIRPGLKRWILRYDRRTGRPEDRIVAFDVYTVVAAIAPPGSKQVKNIVRTKLMSFP